MTRAVDINPKEYQELSEESRIEQQRHAETLRQYEIKRKARAIVVPTAIEDVKTKLRELGHPATLFGEDAADRRERLREVIADMQLGEDELLQVQVISPILKTSRSNYKNRLCFSFFEIFRLK